MPHPPAIRALRDTLELQSAAERFFGALARRATDPAARTLLQDLTRIEHLLTLDVERTAASLSDQALPAPTGRAADVKTAPAWGLVPEPSFDQVLAVALTCCQRAADHHRVVAARLEGPTSAYLRDLADSEAERAARLEVALDREVRARFAGHRPDDVLNETLDAALRAGKRFEALARRIHKPQTAWFLRGMVDVCSLHATSIRALVKDARRLHETERWFDDLLTATLPVHDGRVEDLGFPSALRMAMHAEQRASLVHDMQARAFSGTIRTGLTAVAEAEHRYAVTISSVIERLVAEERERADQDASRKRSGTRPTPDQDPPGSKRTLRLVVG